jgi:hypothetical protein
LRILRSGILGVLVLASVSRLALGDLGLVPTPSHPSTLPQITGELDTKLKEHEKAIIEQDSKLKTINEQIAATATVNSDLARRLAELATLNKERDKAQGEILQHRYEAGLGLLNDMNGSAATVLFIVQVLNVEAKVNKATNLWHDADFRNNYDQINTYGTIIGTVVGIVGGSLIASNRDSSAGAWTLVGGMGVAGISKLLGAVAGKENGDRLKEKAQVIEFTRRAYDDLSARVDALKVFKDTNELFLHDLAVFQAKYSDLTKFISGEKDVPEDELRRRSLNELALQVERFTSIVGQLAIIIGSYDVLIKKYAPSTIKEVQADMAELDKQLVEARKNYNTNVRPYLSLESKIAKIFPRVSRQ